jgi:hypothetical protein
MVADAGYVYGRTSMFFKPLNLIVMRRGIAIAMMVIIPTIVFCQGHFFDERGRYLGDDGKHESSQKFYVLKTTRHYFTNNTRVPGAGIKKSEYNRTVAYIESRKGISDSFPPSHFVYKNVQEFTMSKKLRNEILAIINKDNGIENFDSVNNIEYGGAIESNDRVKEATKRTPLNSAGETTLIIDTTANSVGEFHTHPSGKRIVDGDTKLWYQPPSKKDLETVSGRIGYVFGMHNKDRIVYIYRSFGVLATIPFDQFIYPENYIPPKTVD